MKRTELKRSGPPARTRKTPAAKAKKRADDAWRAYIHARDQVCQYCGKAGGVMNAHHVMIRSFNATRTDENNGILLCFQDHALMHSDPMQAVRFYMRRFGDGVYAALREKAYEGRNQKYPASFWLEEVERLQAKLGEL